MTSKKRPAAASPVRLQSTDPVAPAGKPLAQLSSAPLTPAQKQIRDFDHAVQRFSQRQFEAAVEHFTAAIHGPAPHVSDKARSYLQVCSRKIGEQDLNLKSAEDYFNYGVERLNARDVEKARVQFAKALDLNPNADHVLYTLALACGIAGDNDGAYENLKRAIELEPRNRILARQDPEFSALYQKIPLLRTLLQTESNAPF